MKLVRATDLDNEKLLSFFTKTAIPGTINIRLRRMFNFFNHYRNQSEDYITFMLLNNKDDIEAMATLLFRPAWIEGKKQTIGFASDLRVSNNRRAVIEWPKHFLPLLEKERAERDCKYTFSVLAHSQRQAYNTLIRPRNLRRPMPRYYQYRRFELVSLHGLWPFHRPPLPGIEIRQASENDLAALGQYIAKSSSQKPLHFYHEPSDFITTLDRWRDLFLENFLIARDRKGNIIGCCAPWSPDQVQRIYVTHYTPQAKNLKDFLTLMSWFKKSHVLPKEGQHLPVRHITFLNADNADILYALLYRAYKDSSKREILLYPHFEDQLITTPPKSFISAKKQYSLYCVLAPQDPVPGFLKPAPLAEAPDFEPAFM